MSSVEDSILSMKVFHLLINNYINILTFFILFFESALTCQHNTENGTYSANF